MHNIDDKDILDWITLHGPDVDLEKETVYSTFRDEMFFAQAFFDHYRSLGFEQFIILDDKSEDGTTEFLDAQPDCIRVETSLRYGEEIRYLRPDGKRVRRRAGIIFKGALPRALRPGKFTLYVDADEFLILPPGMTSITQIGNALDRANEVGVVATMVEFFPEFVADMTAQEKPESFSQLLEQSPYFEAEPLIEITTDRPKPYLTGPSKTTRLFDRFGFERVEADVPKLSWKQKLGLAPKPVEDSYSRSPRHKTPYVKHSADVFMRGTHNMNVLPSQDHCLVLAHMVFTSNFADKVARAVKWKSHADGALKYLEYEVLLKRLDQSGAGFLTDRSERFQNPQQFIDCGLMKWPL